MTVEIIVTMVNRKANDVDWLSRRDWEMATSALLTSLTAYSTSPIGIENSNYLAGFIVVLDKTDVPSAFIAAMAVAESFGLEAVSWYTRGFGYDR